MICFELLLKGYDGGTDETDHLVKWVKAPSREALDAFLLRYGLDSHLDGPPTVMDQDDLSYEDGIDVELVGEDGRMNEASLAASWLRESQRVTKVS